MISSKNGMYGFKMRDGENNNWDSVSIDEALIPFQNHMNSDRLIIARTHMGQKIPILNGEPPLLQSGAEHIVPKIVSDKFAISAKKNGTVTELDENKFITVTYDDGTSETFDIMPRTSTTKRNTIISISLNSLRVGDTFETGSLIAWNKAFNNEILSIGKNKKMAMLNYLGKSHEDGYVISKEFQDDFITETVIKIPVVIPVGTKIIYFNKEEETNINDPLIKFQYENEVSIDNYLDDYKILDKEEDTISDDEEPDNDNLEIFYRQNNNIFEIKSPGGKVIDIKIKLNTKTNVDKTLITEWKKQNDKIKVIQDKTGKKLLDNVDTSITRIGTHKLKGVEFEGGLIEFYIDTKKNVKLGDKISNRFGAKGVINHIINQDLTPKAEYTGSIDIFLAPSAILGRKNIVMIMEIYIGKILHFLKPKVKEEYDSKGFESAKKLLVYIYDKLDNTKMNSENIKNITEEDLKKHLDNKESQFNLIMPPFSNTNFKDVKQAANKLKIPLDEKVYIPELDSWSDPVPVGYSYISTMEQLASDYESTRAKAGYNPVTGQPLKRKSKIGGQSLGNLDVYNLLTFDCNNMMKEFFTARSDNFKAKNEMVSNIINYGETSMPQVINKGRTQELFKTMMLSMGLFVKE
jgi:DNA-directed RNA polymerase subunit beta